MTIDISINIKEITLLRSAMKEITGKKVFVGLSGGVDSAVSAYLLKKQGFNVVGAFIKTWHPDFYECGWKEERRDAMRVAAHLEIPFVTIDLEDEYKREVADYMIAEYKAGHTPNPDVMCNKKIKFGAFLQKALSMGSQYVATGHYARVKNEDGGGKLLTAIDEEKEQSYFLWTLSERELSKVMFPIGHLRKSEVRKIAKKIGLPNALKKDSQGICFLGDVDMKDFLSRYIAHKRGKVLDVKGNEIGTHDGAAFVTLGERHGFTITKKSPAEPRYYCISKDMKENSVTVGTAEDLRKNIEKSGRKIVITNTNWIAGSPEINSRSGGKKSKVYKGQVRYHQEYQSVSVDQLCDDSATLVFERPQIASSGQSVVLYDGELCLGGGVIA